MTTASDLNHQLLEAWTIYISFFTVFLTVNVTALGLAATRLGKGPARNVISLTFVGQNVIAVVTGIMMARYTAHVMGEFSATGARELTHFGALGYWGGIGNAIGNGIIGLTWLVLVFVRTKQPTQNSLALKNREQSDQNN